MATRRNKQPVRNLVVILGDQLDREGPSLTGFDAKVDLCWMAEVPNEATHVWSHKARIALFLSAMRHFATELRKQGLPLEYHRLDESHNPATLQESLGRALTSHKPQRVIMTEAGEWRVEASLRQVCREVGIPIEMRPDTHFLCSRRRFAAHARGRKQLRMEFFYREMRREHQILMQDDQPAGGRWNYDEENRAAFDASGPGPLPAPPVFSPDAITREVLTLVERTFPDHPGSLDHFGWAVTPADARAALQDFIVHRLPFFGLHQDAMWTGQPFLHHSLLSPALNLKLIHPREVIREAEKAWEDGHAPLAAVEGFIRQILGWREYVRGIYWLHMPGYLKRNALTARHPLPAFYWNGQTDMQCLRSVLEQTLQYGYAHHIQRLMVTGLYALLIGVDPIELHRWYLAVYVDAVEWVELPNTLGMSQYADGGVMASKPYVATGKYIQRMSNYCSKCRYDPAEATGDQACPLTTLYWDFLLRHQATLSSNPRMVMQLRNLNRISPARRSAIQARAGQLREGCQPQK